MTSDAKIGLLLGLVFIFIIAFIINGLPNLRGDENNNELTTNMAHSQNEPPGLGARERKAREVISLPEPKRKQLSEKIQTTTTKKPSPRFEMPLPSSTSIVKDVSIKKAAEDIKPVAQAIITDMKSSPAKTTRPKTYIVTDGDTLAAIAKRFYGDEEGNKIKNIARIFKANRKQLKSADEIYVGQKLKIPVLPSVDNSKIKGVFPRQDFEKIDSIGRRQISTTPSRAVKTKQSKIYIVREGDSLWRIAAAQLGNGDRYPEISNLNADILENEDVLEVGMRLRLPERQK